MLQDREEGEGEIRMMIGEQAVEYFNAGFN